MIRTHILPCRLPHAVAHALNRESGRIYTEVLVWYYRIYRRTGRWLSPKVDERLNDSFGPSTLHAHSRDAAQQGFAKACTTANANRGCGAKSPHRRKRYRTTVWKATGIKQEGGRLRLARAKGLEPIFVALPPELAALPPTSFVEMRLVYDREKLRRCCGCGVSQNPGCARHYWPAGRRILGITKVEVVAQARGEESMQGGYSACCGTRSEVQGIYCGWG